MSRARPYVAAGLDQQGRYVPTEAAQASTELGAEADDHREAMTAAEAWLLMGIYIASVLTTVMVFSWIAGLVA